MALAHSEYLPAGSSPASTFEPEPPLVAAPPVPVIRPLHDYVLVARDAPADQIGAIFVPDVAKRLRTTTAVVRAVGPGRKLEDGVRVAAPCAVGDRVIVSKWGGDVVGKEADGRHLVMLNADDVLGVYDGPCVA